jgi:hypothetical protein
MTTDKTASHFEFKIKPPFSESKNKKLVLTRINRYKEDYYTYEDEIAGHYSYFDPDFEIRYRLGRIPYLYIERDIDSDVDEYCERIAQRGE